MKTKRNLLIFANTLFALVIVSTLLNVQSDSHKGGEITFPINLGSFPSVRSVIIKPETLLEDVKTGKELQFLQVLGDLPTDAPLIMPIRWSQDDYLEIAGAYRKAIWQDDPNAWHLYKIIFDAACENADNKFRSADLLYIQNTEVGGKGVYAAREIVIEPEYGYVAWGEGATYPRSILNPWTKIDMETISRVPAEKALELADKAGGDKFRSMQHNNCSIGVSTWPWGYNRNDWMVIYSGLGHLDIWIDVK